MIPLYEGVSAAPGGASPVLFAASALLLAAIGLAGALLVSRALAAWLFEVSPTRPTCFIVGLPPSTRSGP